MDTTSPTTFGPDHFKVGYGNGYGYPTPAPSHAAGQVAGALDAPTQAMDMVGEGMRPAAPLGGFRYQAPVTGPVTGPVDTSAPVTPGTSGATVTPAGEPAVEPGYAATQAVPAAVLAADVAAARSFDPAAGGADRRSKVGVIIGVVAVLLIFASGAVILLARSNANANPSVSTASATPSSSSSSGRVHTLPDGTQVDEHGNVIGGMVHPSTTADDTTTVAPTTVAPTTEAPTTEPPTTVAPTTAPPTVPPTVAPTLPPISIVTIPPVSVITLPPPALAKAKINSFAPPSLTVNCTNPLQQFFSIPFTWSTTNATKITVSIDGPGIYNNYPAGNGGDSFPFSCGGPHTYLITAYNAANVATTMTVTLHHT